MFDTLKVSQDGTTIVDLENEWRPMATCPTGLKCLLITTLGVAVLGKWHGPDIEPDSYDGWAPLPCNPKE